MGRRKCPRREPTISRANALIRKGNDFTTVWTTLLKGHTLVEGIPREKYELNRTLTRIPLITGEQLVFDPDVNEFRVQ
jgi:hypothetical protein